MQYNRSQCNWKQFNWLWHRSGSPSCSVLLFLWSHCSVLLFLHFACFFIGCPCLARQSWLRLQVIISVDAFSVRTCHSARITVFSCSGSAIKYDFPTVIQLKMGVLGTLVMAQQSAQTYIYCLVWNRIVLKNNPPQDFWVCPLSTFSVRECVYLESGCSSHSVYFSSL